MTSITQEEIFFNFLKLSPGRFNHVSLQFSASNSVELAFQEYSRQFYFVFWKQMSDFQEQTFYWRRGSRYGIVVPCLGGQESFKNVSEFLEGIGWSNIALNSSLSIELRGILDFTIHSQNSNCYWYVSLWLILKIHYIILLWVSAYVHKFVEWKVCRSYEQILHSSCLVKNSFWQAIWKICRKSKFWQIPNSRYRRYIGSNWNFTWNNIQGFELIMERSMMALLLTTYTKKQIVIIHN